MRTRTMLAIAVGLLAAVVQAVLQHLVLKPPEVTTHVAEVGTWRSRDGGP